MSTGASPTCAAVENREYIPLVGRISHQIVGAKLPSNRQVLKLFFFHTRMCSLTTRESARMVVKEVSMFWEKARLPIRYEARCIDAVEALYEKYRNLRKNPTSMSKKQVESEKKFTEELDNLFDIASANAPIKNQEDRDFLMMQRKKGRQGCMIGDEDEHNRESENDDEAYGFAAAHSPEVSNETKHPKRGTIRKRAIENNLRSHRLGQKPLLIVKGKQISNMPQRYLCGLCVNPCSDPKSLYGANGIGNWVYQVTAKYFQTVFSNAAEKKGTKLSNICSNCWRYIVDYHTFEQSVFGAQIKLIQDANSAAQENVCSLCVCSHDDRYKRLCNNPDNEVYQITFKYMHSVFSNPDGHNLKVICLNCWDHLENFHKFQTDIYEAQKMLSNDEEPPHEFIVKLEDELVPPPMVNQICASQTNEEQVSINSKCYGTDPEFPIQVQVPLEYETINESKLYANEIAGNESLDQSKLLVHDKQVNMKSEVCNTEYRKSLEEISSGFKDANCYQASSFLPKLEIMDVPPKEDSYQTKPEFSIVDTAVQVKSEPIALLDNETVDESKLLLNETREYSSCYQDSISLPKLEIMDVVSEAEFDQANTSDESSGGDKTSNSQHKTNSSEAYICYICGKSFKSRNSYNSHSSRNHLNNKYDKKEEKETKSDPAETYRHQATPSDSSSEEDKGIDGQLTAYSEAYTCNICGQPFKSRNSYNSHRSRKHLKRNYDKNEKKETNRAPAKTYREFDEFLAQVMPSLKCELCAKVVAKFTALEQHFRVEHPQVKCFITCCKRKLKYRCQISKHIPIHIDPNTYKCDICQKSYSSDDVLKYHKRSLHSIW